MEPNKTSSDAKQDTSITTTEVRAETYQPPGAGHVKAKGFRKWLQRFFPWVGETTTSQLNAVHKRSSVFQCLLEHATYANFCSSPGTGSFALLERY